MKHSIETGHPVTSLHDFKIIGRNFRSSWGRKLEEALLIKKHNPALNIQEKSVTIKLLN